MKTKLVLLLLISVLHLRSSAQTFLTKTGSINFYSKTSLEDIKAYNNQVYAVIDAGKKNLAFVLLLKGFLFTRQLQQDHFNENYVESDKYPKSNFSGSYTGNVDLGKDGVYNVAVKGNLTIHGVTKPVESNATMEIKAGSILGKCSFKITPEDYNISIPSLVRDKIAKDITINIDIDCKPTK